MTLAQW